MSTDSQDTALSEEDEIAQKAQEELDRQENERLVSSRWIIVSQTLTEISGKLQVDHCQSDTDRNIW